MYVNDLSASVNASAEKFHIGRTGLQHMCIMSYKTMH